MPNSARYGPGTCRYYRRQSRWPTMARAEALFGLMPHSGIRRPGARMACAGRLNALQRGKPGPVLPGCFAGSSTVSPVKRPGS